MEQDLPDATIDLGEMYYGLWAMAEPYLAFIGVLCILSTMVFLLLAWRKAR